MKHEDPYADDSDHGHDHSKDHNLSVKATATPKASPPVPLAGLSKRKSTTSDGSDTESSASGDSPRRKASLENGSTKERPKKRRRMQTWALRLHAQRLIVRRAILCQVPGINRVRAEAIVNRYPTIGGLIAASVNDLEAITIKESPLGHELAVALKRVFE